MSIVRTNNIGKAIVRFMVGLVILAIIVLVVFKVFIDTDKADNDISDDIANAFDFITETPEATEAAATDLPLIAEATDEPVIEETSTPVPTATPTATPTPAPTPVPTPTPMPASMYSAVSTKAATYPWKMQDKERIANGITAIDIIGSENGGSVISLTGWGYARHEGFNGKNCDIWLMVLDAKNNYKCYIVNRQTGLTGIQHEGLRNSKNLDMCDFTAVIDVSKYPDGEYKMGTAVRYQIDGNTRSFAYTFGDAYNFTVKDGVVTSMGGIENN